MQPHLDLGHQQAQRGAAASGGQPVARVAARQVRGVVGNDLVVGRQRDEPEWQAAPAAKGGLEALREFSALGSLEFQEATRAEVDTIHTGHEVHRGREGERFTPGQRHGRQRQQSVRYSDAGLLQQPVAPGQGLHTAKLCARQQTFQGRRARRHRGGVCGRREIGQCQGESRHGRAS